MAIKYQKRVNSSGIEASFERPRVTALLGARRVGKTTLIESYMSRHPNRKWVFLNMDKRRDRLRVADQELEVMIEEQALQPIGGQTKIWVAIDEAQKSPELFDQIKLLYDTYKGENCIKFILTGSGHLNLHQLAAESLAGRVELMNLREFNLKEAAGLLYSGVEIPSGTAFDLFLDELNIDQLELMWRNRRPFNKVLSQTLDTQLIWGGLPEVLEEETSEDRWRYLANYLQTYLEKDIRSIETIGNLDLYHQLMKVCAEQTGSLRDDQKLLSALGCSRNTLVKYRGYLLATMQYLEIFPYVNSTVKRLVKSPKGYLADNGLVSYLTGVQDPALLVSTGLIGHRFENWFLNELLTWTDRLTQNYMTYFWRTSGGAEVDFVVTVGSQVLPIEVTYSSLVLPKKMRHLRDFLERESKATFGVYLYTGPFSLKKEERIVCLPISML